MEKHRILRNEHYWLFHVVPYKTIPSVVPTYALFSVFADIVHVHVSQSVSVSPRRLRRWHTHNDCWVNVPHTSSLVRLQMPMLTLSTVAWKRQDAKMEAVYGVTHCALSYWTISYMATRLKALRVTTMYMMLYSWQAGMARQLSWTEILSLLAIFLSRHSCGVSS